MLRKKLFRELFLNAGQFAAIFLMVLIAQLAFSGVHAYMDGMADSADRYYSAYNLEDLWLTGENFTTEDLEQVKQGKAGSKRQKRGTAARISVYLDPSGRKCDH